MTQLAVIGAGVQGRAFAVRCARAGLRVVLEDVLPSKLRQAESELEQAGACSGALLFVSTVEDAVREADLVIDFVPDELESKLEIVCMVDRKAPPKTIVCIATRALSVSDLASCTYRDDRCVGVQWEGDGVRLVRGVATSDAALESVAQIMSSAFSSGAVVVEETPSPLPL